MDPGAITTPNLGFLWSSLSFGTFILNNLLLRLIVPKSSKHTKQQEWKWRNTANSLIHSIITGVWACVCFWQSPEIREDLISMYTTSAHGVMALSLGYFVYDLMDMMINHRKRSSYELMIHHVVVIICFGLSVMTRYYLGYGLMALLVEVNSIFLHIRQLMLIQSLRKSHILYRLNSLLTIGTFIVFRITTLGWMTRWLVLHRDELSVTAFTIGSASMPVIMVMNIVLFLRILNSDYRQRQPTNNDGFLNTLHQEELLCNQDKTD